MKSPRRSSQAAEGDTQPDAGQLRRRLKEARAARASLRRSLARARDELDILRAFSLDLFPDVEVPQRVLDVIEAVRAEKLTYLTELQLRALAACVLETEQAGREGVVIEAGTAMGGSAVVLAAAKDQSRVMRVHDVFAMIPPPSEKDGEDVVGRYEAIRNGRSGGLDGDVYYGYREDLLGEVTASFARHGVPVESNNVTLVKGLFQDTLDIDEPVAIAHVDGDWYESTMTCLEQIAPRLVEGGRIMIDDYFRWSGCRAAVDEFFAGRPGYRVEYRAKVHVVRLSAST